MSDREAPVRPDSLRSVLGAAVLFALVLLAFASVKSHRDLVAARDHERLLRTTIGLTEHRIERLHGRIRQLRNDPDTLERLAREELGLVRPGDLVLVLAEEPGDARPGAAFEGARGVSGLLGNPGVPAAPGAPTPAVAAALRPAALPTVESARSPAGAIH